MDPSTTSPPSTSELYSLLDDIASDVYTSSILVYNGWQNPMVSSAFFGALTVCTGSATFVLLTKRGSPKGSIAFMLLAMGAMYAATTLFAAITGYYLSVTTEYQNLSAWSLRVVTWCLAPDLSPSEIYSCALDFYRKPDGVKVGKAGQTLVCANTAALVVNVAIGDTIVWWRAWVVWEKRRAVGYVGAVLLLSTLVMSTLDGVDSCDPTYALTHGVGALWESPGFLFAGNPRGYAASVLSLVTNLLATSLIGYRAWKHRTFIRNELKIRRPLSQVERVLTLLIESGAGYCILWIFLVAHQTILIQRLYTIEPLQLPDVGYVTTFLAQFRHFVEGALIPIIAIYPTIIILLVALDKSQCETGFVDSTHLPPPATQSLVFQPHSSSVTSEAECHEGTIPMRVGSEQTLGREARTDGSPDSHNDAEGGQAQV